MKKAIMTFAAILGFSVMANAEVGFFIGGDLNYKTHTVKTTPFNDGKFEKERTTWEYKDFAIAPTIGISIDETWEIGLSFGIENYNDKTYEENSKAYSAELYGSRYFDLTDKLSWFVEAGVEFTHSMELAEEEYAKERMLDFYIEPGLCYSLSDHWSLELSFDFLGLSYNMYWDEALDDAKNPIDDKKFYKNFDFGCTTSPGNMHELSEAVGLSLFYEF